MKASLIFLALVFVCVFSETREYRSYDGRGNNLENPEWGAVGTIFLRGNGTKSWDARYKNGTTGEPIDGRSARFISNMLPGSGKAVPDPNPISAMHIFWGQFLDHDITLTPNSGEEMLFIEIPDGDEWLSHECEFANCTMPLGRSLAHTDMPNGVREQFNLITSYIDGSSVYGSNPDITEFLKEGPDSCYLKVSKTDAGIMLPKNANELPNANDPGRTPTRDLFLAGDKRSNENPGLASLHTLFVREHNRLCGELAEANPEMNGATLFEEARRWVIAYLQRVTFSEYLTSTLGNVLPPYTGYRPDVNPGIDTLFSTATFRYGHAEVLEEIPVLIGRDYEPHPDGDLKLKECFFNPSCWEHLGIEPLLQGMTQVLQNKVDIFYAEAIRNFLFGTGINNFVAIDLFARNIERGRDHGLISYNQAREFFGLARKETFEQISSNPAVVQAMKNAYETVDDIEVYAGALAEDHYAPGFVGELLFHSLTDQYTRLRDGDRFYYENTAVSGFTEAEVRLIDSTRLADIIIRNTDITRIQCSTFFISETLDCGPDADRPDTGGGATNGSFVGIRDTYQFSWNVDLEAETISIVMSAKTPGWVGFGIADPDGMGGMIGGDAFVGWVKEDGTLHIGNYDLLSRTPDCVREINQGVCEKPEGTALITEASGVEADGWTTVRFTRPLNSDYNWEIIEGFNRIIFAHGPEKRLGFHGDNMARSVVSFFNEGGAPTEAPPNPDTSTTTGPGPTPTEGCIPGAGDFEFTGHYLNDAYILHYTVNRNDNTIQVAVRASANGWVGIGRSASEEPRMVGSRATAGFILNGQPVVAAWDLNGQDESLVVRDNDVELTNTDVCFEDGWTVVRFTRDLDEWDIIVEEGNGTAPETPMVLAFSNNPPTQQDRMNFHGVNRVPVRINFITGEGAEIADYTRLVHGIAMATGWILLHIGGIYARFTKKVPKAFWFINHRRLQYVGFTVAMFGFIWIIVVRIVNQAPQHFNQPYYHGVGGLITMSLAIIQVFLAYLRPHPKKEGDEGYTIRKSWEWQHHSFARICLVLATATAFVGIVNLSGGWDTIYVGAAIGVICTWFVLLINLEYGRWYVLKQERESNLYFKME